ncbi:hypothetical protein SD81_032710 [Tolypothrix campylonemoides VB511288]|nr:hypothetical protein SD81_032710 [Tolypothrix campylonemoides VB511288]
MIVLVTEWSSTIANIEICLNEDKLYSWFCWYTGQDHLSSFDICFKQIHALLQSEAWLGVDYSYSKEHDGYVYKKNGVVISQPDEIEFYFSSMKLIENFHSVSIIAEIKTFIYAIVKREYPEEFSDLIVENIFQKLFEGKEIELLDLFLLT